MAGLRVSRHCVSDLTWRQQLAVLLFTSLAAESLTRWAELPFDPIQAVESGRRASIC